MSNHTMKDGEFLVGEAARAAELQAELRACRARYEAARAALSGVASMPVSKYTKE